jgi:hypothetical protein
MRVGCGGQRHSEKGDGVGWPAGGSLKTGSLSVEVVWGNSKQKGASAEVE